MADLFAAAVALVAAMTSTVLVRVGRGFGMALATVVVGTVGGGRCRNLGPPKA